MAVGEGRAGLTAADRRDLARIGSGPDDSAYYADWPGADWDNLKSLERCGLAATVNQSDWWRTALGDHALAARQADRRGDGAPGRGEGEGRDGTG